jgi:hypothetical protein
MTISGATYREGVAYSPDGAMYVTLASGSTIPAPVFTGQSRFALGTSSAPSILFSGDTSGWFGTGGGIWMYGGGGGSTLKIAGNSIAVNSVTGYTWSSTTAADGSADTGLYRAAANSVLFGSGTSATTTSRTEINKAVTAFTNAVAKATLTITIPNAAHSASMLVRVTGSLGAGGAIGANEATASNSYVISLTRTAGVNATAAISAAFGAAATAVAGAATVTCTAAMSAVSGAVGATNTFTVDVTISRSGGSSDNHTCLVYGQLMNANATGITIA